MTLAEWQNSPEAYLALFKGLFFVIGMVLSINGFFGIMGGLFRWHSNNCSHSFKWSRITFLFGVSMLCLGIALK
jgi:hypothetical protein